MNRALYRENQRPGHGIPGLNHEQASFCAVSLDSVVIRPILLIRKPRIPSEGLVVRKNYGSHQIFPQKFVDAKIHPCLSKF